MKRYSLDIERNAVAEEWRIVLNGNTNFLGKPEPITIGSYETGAEASAHIGPVQAALDKVIAVIGDEAEMSKWQFRAIEQAAS